MQASTQTREPRWLDVLYVVALIPTLLWPVVVVVLVLGGALAAGDPVSVQRFISAWYKAILWFLCYPLPTLVGVPISYMSYRRGHKFNAYVWLAVAMLPLLALISLMGILLLGVLGTVGMRSPVA